MLQIKYRFRLIIDLWRDHILWILDKFPKTESVRREKKNFIVESIRPTLLMDLKIY